MLLRSADLIETEGWIQGMTVKREGDRVIGRCALGALDAVRQEMQAGVDFDNDEWRRAAKTEVIARRMFQKQIGTLNIGAWNDQPERIQEEVADAFRAAAEIDPAEVRIGRSQLGRVNGFPDELEVDLRVAGKKVETDISLKVVDE